MWGAPVSVTNCPRVPRIASAAVAATALLSRPELNWHATTSDRRRNWAVTARSNSAFSASPASATERLDSPMAAKSHRAITVVVPPVNTTASA